MTASQFPGQTLEPIAVNPHGSNDDEFSLMQKAVQLLYNIRANQSVAPATPTLAQVLAAGNDANSLGITNLASLGFRDTSAALDVTLTFTSSTALSVARALTIDAQNTDNTLKLAGGTNNFGGLVTITQATANAGILASTGYSLTGSNATNMVDLAGTWNTSGTPTAFKLNITNTASNAASLLADFQVGGASRFRVRVDGRVTIDAANNLNGGASVIIGDTAGQYVAFANFNSNFGICDANGNSTLNFNRGSGALSAASDGSIGFGASTTNNTASDAFFMRKGAASIQLGANAAGVTNQTLTAASRITSDGVGANLTIAAGNGRGGAAGNLILSSWTTEASGVVGTLTTIATVAIGGLTMDSGKVLQLGNAAAAAVAVASTHSVLVNDSTGTSYKLLAIAA